MRRDVAVRGEARDAGTARGSASAARGAASGSCDRAPQPRPAGAALREAAFTDAPLCICVLDACGRLLEANALFEEVVGPLRTFEGVAFERVGLSCADVSSLRIALDALRSSGERQRARGVRCSTSGLLLTRHFDWSFSALQGGNVVVCGDVVCESERAKQRKEADLLDFFQNAPIAAHWLGADGNILWANNTELRLMGYTAEEYIGQPLLKFCPDDAEIVQEMCKALLAGRCVKDVPVQFRAKDGRVVPLLVDSNAKYEDGQFHHSRCFLRDDTGRKVREARAELMVHELKRSAELFDAFVSRTLHLVRTPCHVGLADLDRLQEGGLSKFEVNEALQEATAVLESVVGMTGDVSDLMRFEQGAALKVRHLPADLKDVGRAAVDSALFLVQAGVKLCFDFGRGGTSFCTDALVLERVLAHLLKNACQATTSGTITLRLTHSEGGVTFAVEDEGCGLEMNDLQYFQRYSTDLKAVEEMSLEDAVLARKKLEQDLQLDSGKEGLGIGLSLSYWLVHSLGGELQGDSKIGRGTKFFFDLPRSSQERGYLAPGEVYRPVAKSVLRSASVHHSLLAFADEQWTSPGMPESHIAESHVAFSRGFGSQNNFETESDASSVVSSAVSSGVSSTPAAKPRPRLTERALYEFDVAMAPVKPGLAKMTARGVFEATKVRGDL
ncbi:hypothetical protein M885DRAFT_17051 [Pelagophyceae sp. CCMP2097]|nr:hypothetical protein M885DRAFT_17051 [Pelagophyceae sp. CCMP2097]